MTCAAAARHLDSCPDFCQAETGCGTFQCCGVAGALHHDYAQCCMYNMKGSHALLRVLHGTAASGSCCWHGGFQACPGHAAIHEATLSLGQTQCRPRKAASHRWNGPLEQIGRVQQDAVAPQADHKINVHVQPAGSSTPWSLSKWPVKQILKSYVSRSCHQGHQEDWQKAGSCCSRFLMGVHMISGCLRDSQAPTLPPQPL